MLYCTVYATAVRSVTARRSTRSTRGFFAALCTLAVLYCTLLLYVLRLGVSPHVVYFAVLCTLAVLYCTLQLYVLRLGVSQHIGLLFIHACYTILYCTLLLYTLGLFLFVYFCRTVLHTTVVRRGCFVVCLLLLYLLYCIPLLYEQADCFVCD